jgi:hypothetical protein
MRRATKRVLGFLMAAALGLLPLVVHPLEAAAAGGTLFAELGSQIVKLDPTTGTTTLLADLTSPTPPGISLGELISDAANHRLFTQQTTFSFDPTVPTTYQLVTVNTQSGTFTISPNLAQSVNLAYDTGTGTLFGLTCCPSSIVKVDPATGAETVLAPLTMPVAPSVVVGPASHTIYLISNSFATFPPTSQLVTVDTQTGLVTPGPNLSAGMFMLGYDAGSGTLLGKTFQGGPPPCCPSQIVSIAPATGTATLITPLDPNSIGGNSLAVDPSSHTIYVMQDYLGAFSFTQRVTTINEAGGATTQSGDIPLAAYITNLAFEAPPAITPASIKADVQQARSTGAIDNAGIAHSLLGKLNEAASARREGECDDATESYRAFIRQVRAQSGKHVAATTATQLISEAQFLIAHCP